MVNVSEELKNAFLTGRQKNLTLKFYKDQSVVDTLENDSIVLESMNIDQLLCSEQQLTFGLCSAAKFTIQIYNGQVSHKDLWVKPVISAEGYTFNLGVYRVLEDVVSDDRNTRTLTCYDALYDVVNANYADWYHSLPIGNNRTMTLKQFRDSFFSRIGISQVSTNLVNDGIIVDKTIETNTLSGSDVLKAILEPNAAFGFIDYNGNFKYVFWEQGTGLFPSEDLYPAEDLYPIGVRAETFGDTVESEPVLDSLIYADYHVTEITGVKIQTSSEDYGVVIGELGNTYSILGNFLLFGKSSSELQTIGRNFLEYADQILFRPCKFKVRSHPWVELGDIVLVKVKSHRGIVPVLQRKMTGITALYDEYEAQGNEQYAEQANNLSTMVENLKYKTLELKVDVDGISSEVTEARHGDDSLDTHISKIQQTADAVTVEVEEARNGQSSLKAGLAILPHTISMKVDGGSSGTIGQNKSASIVISLLDENGNPVGSSANGTITLTGDVVFKSNLDDGVTRISGSNLKTGQIEAASIFLYNGDTYESGDYYTRIDASTGALSWLAANSSMSDTGFLTINGATINENVNIYGSLYVHNENTGYFTRIDASTGAITWDMNNSKLDSSGSFSSKNGSQVAKIEKGVFKSFRNDSQIIELGTQTWEGSGTYGMALNAYSKTGDCEFIAFGYENPTYYEHTGHGSPGDARRFKEGYTYLDLDVVQRQYTSCYTKYVCANMGTTSQTRYWGISYPPVTTINRPTIQWFDSLVFNYGLDPDSIDNTIVFYEKPMLLGGFSFRVDTVSITKDFDIEPVYYEDDGHCSINIDGNTVLLEDYAWTSTINGNKVYDSGSGNSYAYYFKNTELSDRLDENEGVCMVLEANFLANTYSDRRVKKDLEDVGEKYIGFYESIEPKRFKYEDDVVSFMRGSKDNKYRLGLIAQDIEELLEENDITDSDLVIKVDKIPHKAVEDHCPDGLYRMNYDDFHALHIQYAHHLKDKIDELEKKNAELEARLARLESLIGEK